MKLNRIQLVILLKKNLIKGKLFKAKIEKNRMKKQINL